MQTFSHICRYLRVSNDMVTHIASFVIAQSSSLFLPRNAIMIYRRWIGAAWDRLNSYTANRHKIEYLHISRSTVLICCSYT